ncbi:L-2-hydroxyglutarate oxidase [Serratia proteamaculans]|uniref:L-2-hydroxyglutarate oxidase n=1 Tax=Serratia proteamaculans TaxID=28151 RepID=A0A7U0N6P2_SERPR|nr:L-2-hydroxyglutarate oxidase [Serratia proteamaculans]HCV64073.1 L-2-hydroxyglutarate oxidase [Serratia sp. (in: enterobacteria)]MBO1502850.1 L-2-hydroxyglutarate oxidase [Serratia proteamaculans]MDW5509136.1 L-2-hydroxyglutarate oxidase [Serratia proteamaculans]QQX53501.1 L-2-hydroxyglutarate oxidase [Serratia proteamaculans]CAI1635655.1 L-2-hydroxyglutarate oxidase LhgO [Serratia proteamaculans]
MHDVIIIGAGLVGLGVANALQEASPSLRILILEKESGPAAHQSGHNSNVVHSGIYYAPGSLKARLAKLGNQSMFAFCREHDLYHDQCGKVIVATQLKELDLLENIYQRGLQNGLAVSRLSQAQLREREPHVNGLEALLVPDAGIVNYSQVAAKLAEIIQQRGGEIHYGQQVEGISESSDDVSVRTQHAQYQAKWLVNCAGLFSDRIAALAGYQTGMKIVPFRGEYYVLNDEKNYLVNHLIYPVPNPDFPFLGVHFTRMYNGKRDVGPNAVLAFKREGYRKCDFSLRDLSEVLGYRGFWKIAGNYLGEGLAEVRRSLSRQRFTENARRLIPELQPEDIQPGPAGVRAQALTADGKLVDDFHFVKGRRSLHVCNAPSPAATASLEIGREIVRQHLSSL